MRGDGTECRIYSFMGSWDGLGRLDRMRKKYDAGGYEMLIVVGIGENGQRDEVELGPPSDYQRSVKQNVVCLGVSTMPLQKLDAMRQKYNQGLYRRYVATGMTVDGEVDTVSLSRPENYRHGIKSGAA